MEPPEGYQVPQGSVCKLIKSSYGLKQASRKWNEELIEKIESFGFTQSKHDYCLFTKQTDAGLISLLLYVDDILVAGPSDSHIIEVKRYLDNLFTIKDLGEAKYFLGLEIARTSQGLKVTQTKYVTDLINDMGLARAKTTTTPLPVGVKFTAKAGGALSNPSQYRRLIGRVLYLGYTRPDISHATQQLSQFIQRLCQQQWEAVVHFGSLLEGSLSTGLFFLTGYCLFLGSAPVSWKMKKQATVSRSTAEAEYRKNVNAVLWTIHYFESENSVVPRSRYLKTDRSPRFHRYYSVNT
ncbi:UNVERIFIED_CONTAM: Retrovirus-related Pol polyprotein from transposon RE1 [Sesamum radiatum]|uniref:Retrovirus-related Pol polyprotein from transposon RE1 n=1 Tax=Sesamum radiatum TaxID=300843 RepID=A0AAW2MZK3_SESRA